MSSFVLKIIAIISMFIDHASLAFYGEISPWNYIGRLAFPIFAFQLVQGFNHTSNFKKYCSRILLFAFISQLPFSFFLYTITGEILNLNVFFTLSLGLIALHIYKSSPSKPLGIILCLVIAGIAELIHVDYGYYGILLILLFYLTKDNKIFMTLGFILLTLIKFLPAFINTNFYYVNVLLFAFTTLAIIPILFYNGKRGKKMTYFFYLFYPLHLILLTFVCFSVAI